MSLAGPPSAGTPRWRARWRSRSSTTCCRGGGGQHRRGRQRARSSRPPCWAARAASPGSGCRWPPSTPAAARPTSRRTTAYVSLAAPGAMRRLRATAWCPPCRPTPAPSGTSRPACRRVVPQAGVRFAYGQGTSFAAPIVVGDRRAGLAGRAAPGLGAGGRGADPLGAPDRRPGLEPVHRRRESWTARAATALARIYDVTSPARQGHARTAAAASVSVRVAAPKDRTRARARARRPRDLRRARLPRRRPQLQRGRRRPPPPFRKSVRLRGLKRERVRGGRLRPQRQLRRQAARALPARRPGPRGSPSVDRRPVDAHLEVQVRAEAVAGVADVADHLALRDRCARSTSRSSTGGRSRWTCAPVCWMQV